MNELSRAVTRRILEQLTSAGQRAVGGGLLIQPFAADDVSLTALSRELKAEVMVFGHVRCASDRFLIALELWEGRTGRRLWIGSHGFDPEGAEGVFGQLAAEISRCVASLR